LSLGSGAENIDCFERAKYHSLSIGEHTALHREASLRLLELISRVAAIAAVVAATSPGALAQTAAQGPDIAVGPQYDSTHVYVDAADFDRFVAGFAATFGGTTSKKASVTVTPTPSLTASQIAQTPVGLVSAFGYATPVPFPFGLERTGYLVSDLDVAVAAARANGAAIVVAPFNDPIGRDAIIEWPGGVFMQLYWHTTAPHYAPLASVPENRVYVSPDAVDGFIRSFDGFAHGSVVSDDAKAPGIEIGRPSETYRRVRIDSPFGKLTVLVTDGHLPYPYGRETTGYEVSDFAKTLERAVAAGATVLVPPYASDGRNAALVTFPGGYIAEIHALAK
jgi:predicted enzyme related to lactoylglutathione lyase